MPSVLSRGVFSAFFASERYLLETHRDVVVASSSSQQQSEGMNRERERERERKDG